MSRATGLGILWSGLRRLKGHVLIPLLLVSLLPIYLWHRIFIPLDSGQAGVLWKMFGDGTVLDVTYGEGLHIILPWDRLYIYDVRVQRVSDRINLLSSNGLFVEVAVSTRFQPRLDALPQLHKSFGTDFVDVLIRPAVISALRGVIGNYTAEEIYSRDEQGLLKEMYHEVSLHIDRNFVDFRDVLILELKLPEKLQAAINDKLTKKQIANSYVYRLERERSERERRQIEAEGVKQFEAISGIPILRWRGLEVTEQLAQSPNAKVIVLGTSGNDLPIILNAEEP